MKFRNYLMLAGTSAIALCAGSSIMAQTVTNPGLDLTPTYTITAPQIIDSGVADAGAAVSSADVHDVPTGILRQNLDPTTPGIGSLSLTNDGSVTVGATATTAETTGLAIAQSSVTTGISQSHTAPDAVATIDLVNRNDIAIAAHSVATSTGSLGGATAESNVAPAIGQSIETGGSGTSLGRTGNATLTNAANGSIAIGSHAEATSLGYSSASAIVTPAVMQVVDVAGTGSASFANAGTFNVDAGSIADGATAVATSQSTGVAQELLAIDGTTAAFANAGEFDVAASTMATGAGGAGALADTLGLKVTGDPIDLAVTNNGNFSAAAHAVSDGLARADAVGMSFHADFIPAVVLPAKGPASLADVTNRISGTVTNNGALTVWAKAEGGDAGTPASFPEPSIGYAVNALGVDFLSSVNTATLTNKGTITVSAISNGDPVGATGILVRNFPDSPVAAGEGDSFNLVNDGGTIIARESTDGGVSWTRGTAIDTANSPNPAVLQLKGAGSIYGDIDTSAADAITVSAGETRLDGVINPFTGDADALVPAGPLQGSLTIANGGTLFLVDQPNGNPSYSGPAGANVETFTVANGGTLALQLPTNSNPAIAQAAYPFVNAGTANLGGTLEVRPASQNGLYANSYVFNDVINADTRNGTFANVVTNGGSPLLHATASYDEFANVDLSLNRVGFGSVAGLTFNQQATGNGIEHVYSPNLTGPFANLLGNVFQVGAAGYPDALNQLSGDQYAGYLQGLRNHSMQVNGMVSDQIDCAISVTGPLKCANRDGEARFWVLGSHNWVKADSDFNAPGYKSKNWSGLAGVDYTMGNFTIGAFGGYRDTKMDFSRNNGRIKGKGWQAGLLAGYDSGSFYIRGLASYSKLNGKSIRDLAIGTTAGRITGRPDAKVISLYGETGTRISMGSTWLTPFVGVDHTKVSMKGFTETGVPGANLAFGKQNESQTSGLAGLKWAGNLGGIIPEAKIAYRYDLSKKPFGVDASFADAPLGSDFRVLAPRIKRGSIVAGFSLAAALGDRVTGRIGYQGRFNSDVRDHALFGSLTFRFGGSTAMAPVEAAPPPPPPAPPPPPPPPPVTVIECNKGPYIVFFDWDKSDITPEAGSVLDNAITAYGNCNQVQIMLAGHADRSGGADYNRGLSERRNTSVRGYLGSHGIADGGMTSQAFGESSNRVPTADGVRELQNRRVEITYGPGSGY
jgi:uncharacterized protein with beta-barrel porin domain